MTAFGGFSGTGKGSQALPEQFFTELVPAIDDLGELKLTLYVLWRIRQVEGPFPFLWEREILEDADFWQTSGEHAEEAQTLLLESLDKAVTRGSLLKAEIQAQKVQDSLYIVNSPKGRAALQAIEEGNWDPAAYPPGAGRLTATPNIYRLYEDHIGPLSPMIGEALAEAEESYPGPWIEEAFRIAVENNVRRWRYVAAILRSWQEEGRDERESRGDPEADRRRYVRGKFAKYIEH